MCVVEVPGLVGSVRVPAGGVVVYVVLNVVLGVVDDFVVHDLGFREFEDYHGTCEQKETDDYFLHTTLLLHNVF